jgi:hypothetical protein
LKVRSFAFFGSFATSTLPLKFPNTTRVPKKEKDRTDPEILYSHTLNVMGNFNSNILAQKKGQKAKKPDFQALDIIELDFEVQRSLIHLHQGNE